MREVARLCRDGRSHSLSLFAPQKSSSLCEGAFLKGERMSLYYNGKNIQYAKELRKNATPQENRLWYDFLSKYEIRFQRQKAIDNFIVDFYCHKAKLIIEIDGSQHFTELGKKSDDFRTERLEGYELNVIRISNNQINENFKCVCEYIDWWVKESLHREESPSQKSKISDSPL